MKSVEIGFSMTGAVSIATVPANSTITFQNCNMYNFLTYGILFQSNAVVNVNNSVMINNGGATYSLNAGNTAKQAILTVMNSRIMNGQGATAIYQSSTNNVTLNLMNTEILSPTLSSALYWVNGDVKSNLSKNFIFLQLNEFYF